MKVEFETRDGEHATYARPEAAHRPNESRPHVWIRTAAGKIKRADMV